MKRMAKKIQLNYRYYLRRCHGRAQRHAILVRRMLEGRCAAAIQSMVRGRLGRRRYVVEKSLVVVKSAHVMLVDRALHGKDYTKRVFWYKTATELAILYKDYYQLVERTGYNPPICTVEENINEIARRILEREAELVTRVQVSGGGGGGGGGMGTEGTVVRFPSLPEPPFCCPFLILLRRPRPPLSLSSPFAFTARRTAAKLTRCASLFAAECGIFAVALQKQECWSIASFYFSLTLSASHFLPPYLFPLPPSPFFSLKCRWRGIVVRRYLNVYRLEVARAREILGGCAYILQRVYRGCLGRKRAHAARAGSINARLLDQYQTERFEKAEKLEKDRQNFKMKVHYTKERQEEKTARFTGLSNPKLHGGLKMKAFAESSYGSDSVQVLMDDFMEDVTARKERDDGLEAEKRLRGEYVRKEQEKDPGLRKYFDEEMRQRREGIIEKLTSSRPILSVGKMIMEHNRRKIA